MSAKSWAKKILVGSVYLNPTPARLLVSDPVTDMAAIRIYNVKPPAILSVFDERSGRGDLDIVGYPGDVPGLVATQTNGKIRADRPPSGQGLDSRPYVWFDSPAVRPGFSGGPIIGPNGDAIGAVVGHVTTTRRSDSQVVSETKRVFGASTRMFEEFLRREAPWVVFDAGRSPSAENLKKAIVKIVCER